MRLFIAIDFNEHRDYLASLQNKIDFPDTRLNFTRAFHLTLKFLGEVQSNIADSMIESLKLVKSKQFTPRFDRIGMFPGESNIRVVWLGICPEEPVLKLQKAVDESLHSLFKKEKDFKAHITIARVKSVGNKKDFADNLKNLQVENKPLNVKEFLLIKSELKPDGPLYNILEKFKLAD